MVSHLVISSLEEEWDLESGFLGRLRNGNFDAAAFSRLTSILDGIDIQDEPLISRRLVSLLWYIPTFMEWQRQRIIERGGSEADFNRSIVAIQNSLENILGVP